MQSINVELSTADHETKKIKRDRYHRHFIQTVYDFAENTTLNGLKYISERGTPVLERLFWISTFLLSTVLCVMMVYKSYVKFDTSAVAVTLKERPVSVNEYPFPAVTICSQAKIRQKKYNYTKYALQVLKNSTEYFTEEDYKKIHSASVFCNREQLKEQVSLLNYTIDMDTFFQIAPKHEDIFLSCKWRNNVDCLKKFRPTLTAQGVCYTFNNLASDEIFRKSSIEHKRRRYFLNTSTPQDGWSLEKNYFSSKNDTFPRRGRANGATEDVVLILKEVKDRDFECELRTQPGYSVYLHHPAELPQASLHRYTAQPGKTTSLALKLEILDTAVELADYTPQIRQCYFTSERYLQFFQKYTSSNCQLECLTNYTIQSCGCVSFFMPRNGSINICKADKLECIEDALDQYANEEDLNDSDNGRCGCLPECHDVNYDADAIVTKLDLRELKKKVIERLVTKYVSGNGDSQESYVNKIEANKSNAQVDEDDFDDNSEIETLTVIRIYYRRPRFVAMERSELVGLSQFLADVGGTLGLFLGFSFLTLAEIFYFFSIKLCCTFHRQNPRKCEVTIDIDDD